MRAHPFPTHVPRALALCALASCMSLTACELLGLDGNTQPPPKQATKPKTTPKPKLPTAEPETKKVVVEYVRPNYPNNARRNPFQPDDEVFAPTVIDTPEERPVEPLERFTLAQLELVAIISEISVPKAMFVDPDKFGHFVKKGDRVGRQGGIIVDIRDNEVDIREVNPESDDGQAQVKTVRLRSIELRGEGDEDLSEVERQALDRLLRSKQGREGLLRQLQEQGAQGAAQPGTLPPSASGGTAPPR